MLYPACELILLLAKRQKLLKVASISLDDKFSRFIKGIILLKDTYERYLDHVNYLSQRSSAKIIIFSKGSASLTFQKDLKTYLLLLRDSWSPQQRSIETRNPLTGFYCSI